MTDLVEEIQKHNLNVAWDQEGFAFKREKEVVSVPWTSVVKVDLHSRLRYGCSYTPVIENKIVIKYKDKEGNDRVFEDDLSIQPVFQKWNRHVVHGLLQMAVEKASRDAISKEVTEFISSNTTFAIEKLKRKAVVNLFFNIGLGLLIIVIGYYLIQLRNG